MIRSYHSDYMYLFGLVFMCYNVFMSTENKEKGVLTTQPTMPTKAQDNTQQPNKQEVEKGLITTLDISQETAPFIINPNFMATPKVMKLVDKKVIASISQDYVDGSKSILTIMKDNDIPVYCFYKLKEISPEFASLVDGITEIRANVLIDNMNELVNSLREDALNPQGFDPKQLHAKTNAVNVLCHCMKMLAGIFNKQYAEKKAGSVHIHDVKAVNFIDMLKEPKKREVIEAPAVDTHQRD